MPLEMADTTTLAKDLRSLLREAPAWPCTPLPLPLILPALTPPGLSDKAQAQITTMNIQLGDRVVIAGQKGSLPPFPRSTNPLNDVKPYGSLSATYRASPPKSTRGSGWGSSWTSPAERTKA
ncbi:CAP-Gly domain-containing linker protein 4-like [Oncorhynchus kisutch]|uniref:CAP-Gly domain-containing linker protein 4-like n=1 Tax=Oncorhynchus kisutch TaxID=8019 RepID=UPI0012DE5673|nr:CAP-Gly domain-containing linker protein 4-like [Oncorhynchus kisutch]